MQPVTRQMATKAVEYIRANTLYTPTIGLVLGTGLNALADRVHAPDIIPYAEIPSFPRPTVPGHSGRLLLGKLGGAEVCVMQGRPHYYEGYSPAQITLPIRAMQLLGVTTLIVTNAAGGIRDDLKTGDVMAIIDQINLVGMAGNNPLLGPNDESFGPRFPDMSQAYDPKLLDLLRAEAQALGIALQEGVYAMVSGPSFETPAEVRFLRAIGADAVGMSTAPEVTVACHGGLRVLGISLISNIAIDSLEAALADEISHEEVLEAGRKAMPVLTALVEGLLRRLASQRV